MSKEKEVVPVPSTETLGLLREFSKYAVSRQPMRETSRETLEHMIHDQTNNTKLGLAIIGSHKMQGMADLISLTDLYGQALAKVIHDPDKMPEDPEVILKILRLLYDMQMKEIEYLRLMTSTAAEKQGFSSDPRNQLNIFLSSAGYGTASAVTLPEDMTVEGRRKLHTLFNGLLSMVEGTVPEPPAKVDRYVESELDEGRGKKESDGPGDPD